MPFHFAPERVLLMDGAMGTQLQEAGARAGECFELWNLTHPDCVRSIHEAYVRAGAEVLLTNTFQANPVQLAKHGLLELGPHLCRAAVDLARAVQADSRGQVRWVIGDIGPITEPLVDDRSSVAEEKNVNRSASEVSKQPRSVSFARPEPLWQTAAWLDGVDALLIETCSDWSVWQAIRWLQQVTKTPILLSQTFRSDANSDIRTWDGHAPEEYAAVAAEHNLAGLGVNCGANQGMAEIAKVLRRFSAATVVPLFARPNAGTPVPKDGRWFYPLGPEQMAAQLPELLAIGVRMMGGCCGTTPAHIAALTRVLR